MSELTGAQLLSEATAVLLAMAENGIRIDDRRFERYVQAVVAEYDRRGEALASQRRIVEAATAVARTVRPGPGDPFWGKTWSGYEPELCSGPALHALVAAVNEERP